MGDRRKNPRSIEQRVYKWARLRAREVTSKEVAEALKIGHWSAIQAIQRLIIKGSIERRGMPHPRHRKYAATDKKPLDGRGLMPGSLLALRKGMQKPKGEIPKPKPAIALEECWGFLPVSTVADEKETCSNSRAQLRPDKTEAA